MLTRWFNCLILGLITLLNFSAGQALAAEKKNVCAMTINSNDEIELFKKHLSKDLFNFIELTKVEDNQGASSDTKNEADSANAWLKASCRQGIKCDVLVISGHFGGAFFGSSNINLPLETLESASCDSACSGVLHAPKEVFLFGCNTLAGKERDSRTPEQYARVLVEDGFSETQAQQIAAFRYSAIGSSFSDRMSRIFAKVPRIYGFTSIAPSGKTITPFLTRYLKETAPTYFEQLVNMTANSNTVLKEHLKGMPLAQINGAGHTNTPVCYIKSETTSTIGKLQYILEVLEKGGALELAPYLSDYFAHLDEKKLNPAEKRLLEKVYENTMGRNKLAAFIAKPIRGLLKPQVDTLNLMYNINWLNKTDYNRHMDALVLSPLYNKEALLTRELVDQMCSLDAKVRAIDVRRIPESFWNKRELYEILNCLEAENDELLEMVSMHMFSLGQKIKLATKANVFVDADTVRLMLNLFATSKYLDEGIIDRISSLLKIEPLGPFVILMSEHATFTSKKLRLEIEQLLARNVLKPLDAELARAAVLNLGRDDESFMLAQYEDFIAGRSEYTSYSFQAILNRSDWLRDKVFQDLSESNDDRRLRPLLALVLGVQKYKDTQLKRIQEIILSDSFAPSTRMVALDVLVSAHVGEDLANSVMKKILQSKTHYQLRAMAWKLFKLSVPDPAKEALELMTHETHPLLKNAFELQAINSAQKEPYQHHNKYHLGQIDTQSLLSLRLQQGKEIYALVPRKPGARPSSSGIEVRSIILGVDEETYLENERRTFANYIPTRVLYDGNRDVILGIMGDYSSSASSLRETDFQGDRLLFTTSQLADVTFLGSVLQINLKSGRVVQDYSVALQKAQSDILSEL
ncbi:MAG TPA: hypothetical protein VGE46_01400, partial [Bdellovibrio sp.]